MTRDSVKKTKGTLTNIFKHFNNTRVPMHCHEILNRIQKKPRGPFPHHKYFQHDQGLANEFDRFIAIE